MDLRGQSDLTGHWAGVAALSVFVLAYTLVFLGERAGVRKEEIGVFGSLRVWLLSRGFSIVLRFVSARVAHPGLVPVVHGAGGEADAPGHDTGLHDQGRAGPKDAGHCDPGIGRGGVGGLGLFALSIGLAVAGHHLLHLPPVFGMMTGLGLLKLFIL